METWEPPPSLENSTNRMDESLSRMGRLHILKRVPRLESKCSKNLRKGRKKLLKETKKEQPQGKEKGRKVWFLATQENKPLQEGLSEVPKNA